MLLENLKSHVKLLLYFYWIRFRLQMTFELQVTEAQRRDPTHVTVDSSL